MTDLRESDSFEFEVALTCGCVPRHRCCRNKATQFPEKPESANLLRQIDLVPIPKPEIVLLRTLRSTSVQVELGGEILKPKKEVLVHKEAATSVGGFESLTRDIEESEKRVDDIIAKYLRSPRKETQEGPTTPSEWPEFPETQTS